ERRTLASHKKAELISKFSIKAIAIAHGKQSQLHRLSCNECSVVADCCSRRHASNTNHLCLPTEHGLELLVCSRPTCRFIAFETGVKFGRETVESQSRAQHRFHSELRSECGDRRCLTTQQGRGVAHVQPLWTKPRGFHAREGRFGSGQLLSRHG